jgi:hypothetical protein
MDDREKERKRGREEKRGGERVVSNRGGLPLLYTPHSARRSVRRRMDGWMR